MYDNDMTVTSSNPKLIYPSQLMHCAIRPTSKNIDLNNIDKDPKYDPDMLCCHSFSRKAITTDNLGNANNRSKAQSDRAKYIANEYLNQININSLICFTDGSALGNPGPCGAGAVIYVHSVSNAPFLLKRPISSKSVSYHGELAATDFALEYCQPYSTSHPNINKIIILSDCQSAITTVSSYQYPSNFTNILCKIYDRIKQLSSKSIDLEMLWIAAHTGITGNELADQCAKEDRSKAQSNRAKYIANEYLNQINTNSLICFTDGSALGNPGHCGAGAVIYVDSVSNAPILLKRPVSSKSVSYHGGLATIDFALEYCQPYSTFSP